MAYRRKHQFLAKWPCYQAKYRREIPFSRGGNFKAAKVSPLKIAQEKPFRI